MEMSDQFSNMVRTAFALACCVAGIAQTPPRPRLTPEQQEQMRQAQEERLHNDWADLKRYRDQDASLGAPAADENRVVFMGDSITDGWIRLVPVFFQGRTYLDRGISGQTTPQMLVRFRQDVIN